MAKKVNCTEIEATIAEVALLLATKPEHTSFDSVAKAMESEFGVNRETLVNSIDAYSRKEIKRQADEARKKLADIRGEARTEAALRRVVAKLESELAQGDPETPASPEARKQANEVIQMLRKQRDKLRSEVELQARIKDLTEQIDSEKIKPTEKRQFKEVSDEVAAMRQERSELQAQVRQLREIERLSDYLRKLAATGIIAPVTNREIVLSDARKHNQAMLDRLRYDIRQVEEKFKPKTLSEKIFDYAGVPRSIMSSVDFSAFGLQGWFNTVAHPVIGIKQLIRSIYAAVSHVDAVKMNNDIINDPMFLMYKDAGGYLAPIEGGSIDSREEAFNSSLAESIPLFGRLIKASGRAYATFLNGLRFNVWKQLMKNVPTGMPPAETAKQFAQFTNLATGRGSLGKRGNMAVPFLNTLFFSIRNWVSRLQMLTLVPYKIAAPQRMGGYDPVSRKVIAKEYAKFLAGTSIMLALLDALGGEWEKDPRGSGFGKIRFGNTTVDLTAQLGAELNFLSKIVTGQRKTREGEVIPLMSFDFGREQSGMEMLATKVRSKLSPMASLFVDYASGKDFMGKPFNAKDAFADRFVPLSIGETIEAFKTYHPAAASLVSTIGLFGFRPTYYDPKEAKKEQRRIKREWERKNQ